MYVHNIVRAVGRGSNLTRQLLTFSRRQPLQLKDIDLNEVVANTAGMLKRLIGENILLECILMPEPAFVNGDAGMIEQMLINLAINSRDAMEAGGRLVVRTVPASIQASPPAVHSRAKAGDYFRLSVSDSGCGIAPEHLPHIFDPFFTTKDVGKGTGLGLASVFGIIEQHHGWVEAESRLGRGTTISLYFPRVSQSAHVDEVPQTVSLPVNGHETILVAEDETAILQVLKLLLSGHGYTVLEAPSGTVALDIWRQSRSSIDLLLTDMVMPEGLSGIDLAKQMRKEIPELRIIFCSGYSPEFFEGKFVLGAHDYFLHKPYDPNDLLLLIRKALDAA
jgi:CheY-like chemotaxis protein